MIKVKRIIRLWKNYYKYKISKLYSNKKWKSKKVIKVLNQK